MCRVRRRLPTHTFRPGLWASASAAFGLGGSSAVNGEPKGDYKQDFLFSLAVGQALSRNTAVKLAWIRTTTQANVGYDSDTVAVAFSVAW